jgi:hypothetical protein
MGKIKLKKAILFICFLFSTSIGFAQVFISGKITDSLSAGIGYVHVSLTDENNAVMAYTIADAKGIYELSVNKPGKFNLLFSDMQYEKRIVPLFTSLPNISIKIDVILTKRKAYVLNEVLVSSSKPIVIKKDTIVFDVNSFKQGNERVLEDLLRKIPGVTVEDDGTVKVGNKEVEKVMVEGDDFFEKGYKVLTKNMPVQPLDKVEIIQNYSANKLLKGIEQTDRVALNLKLKADAKGTWFGNIDGGVAVDDHVFYDNRFNLMNFSKKTKYYFLSNFNNIGYDATGDIDNLIKPNRSMSGGGVSIGDDESVQQLLNKDVYGLDFKKDRINFNSAKLLSLNAIFNPLTNLKIKTLGFFNADDNSMYRNTIENFQLPNTSFTNTEILALHKNKFIGFGKIDLNYDIAADKSLNIITNYNNDSFADHSDLIFNNIPRPELLNTTNQRFDQKILFTYKLREKSVLLFTGRIINEQSPQIYSTNTFFFNGLFPNDSVANNLAQSITNTMRFYGLEGKWLSRSKKDNLLEISFGNKLRIDDLNSTLNINQGPTTIDQPPGYQNNVHYKTNTLYLDNKYTYTISKIDVSGSLNIFNFDNTFNSVNQLKNQNSIFIDPRVEIKWKINNVNKLFAVYGYYTTTNKIVDIYDDFLLTDFQNFSKGTGEINPLNSSAFSLNYQLGDFAKSFFASSFISYNLYNDYFTNNSQITPDYSLTKRLLIHNKNTLNFQTNINYYFHAVSTNVKLTTGYINSDYQDIVNANALRQVNTKNYALGLELHSSFNGIFNYNMGWKLNKNTFTTNLSSSVTNNYYFLDLLINVNKKVNFQLSDESYHFGSVQGKADYQFLDLTGRYNIANNKLLLSVSGKNLLNTKTFTTYSVSDIGSSTTEYRLLPRYVMIKLNYTF